MFAAYLDVEGNKALLVEKFYVCKFGKEVFCTAVFDLCLHGEIKFPQPCFQSKGGDNAFLSTFIATEKLHAQILGPDCRFIFPGLDATA